MRHIAELFLSLSGDDLCPEDKLQWWISIIVFFLHSYSEGGGLVLEASKPQLFWYMQQQFSESGAVFLCKLICLHIWPVNFYSCKFWSMNSNGCLAALRTVWLVIRLTSRMMPQDGEQNGEHCRAESYSRSLFHIHKDALAPEEIVFSHFSFLHSCVQYTR